MSIRRPGAVVTVLGALVIAACADAVIAPAITEDATSGVVGDGAWLPIVPASISFHPDQLSTAVREWPIMGSAAPPAEPAAAHALAEQATLRWNAAARELVAFHRENPPRAARAYALLSIAQYDALVALRRIGVGTRAESERAALAGASFEVLSALFATSLQRLAEQVATELAGSARGGGKRDIENGYAIGRAVGSRIMEHAQSDGADATWTGEVPSGPSYWISSAVPPAPPLLPHWGDVRPWLMTSGAQFRPMPPPDFASPEFQAAVAEVREISDHRTSDQLASALFWADDPGTATPPGHWNRIAAELIHQHHMPEIRAAWTLALLNMALMDASISCWDAKYVYWLMRPSQVDPLITTPVPLPNFPSYTSGHATFSGAASELLAHVFPARRAQLRSWAEEAAASRVYGGIHYRFDSEIGLEAGFAIGRLAVERGRRLNPGVFPAPWSVSR